MEYSSLMLARANSHVHLLCMDMVVLKSDHSLELSVVRYIDETIKSIGQQ
ncbi:MAG: hypothetical protein ACERKD_14345 [Prolixibacteraceae bacterium]